MKNNKPYIRDHRVYKKCECNEDCASEIEWKDHYFYTGWPRILRGHHNKGILSWNKGKTKETCSGLMQISKKLTGRPLSEQRIEKAKNTMLKKYSSGEIAPWNKGLTKTNSTSMNIISLKNTGKRHSEETIKKLSKAQQRRFRTESVWNKGLTKENSEVVNRISLSKKGKPTWIKGRTARNTISIAEAAKKRTGENHVHWRGGFVSYSPGFTESLKKEVKIRDNFTCQECGVPGVNLVVHHIDYNKSNHIESNLIALCRPCHQKTNYNREYWEKKYKTRSLLYA